jgi:ribosome biogenesis GTPase
MDALLIVASACQPPLHHGLIDRFLIAAERGELEPVLAINKIDLAEPDETVLGDYRALEVRILPVSAVTGEGVDGLRAALASRSSVLAGASGVGKSTLVNALVPGAEASTGRVRTKDERGRHTTTAAAVYDLPGGGMLVDTPGIRELGVHLDAAELPWFFPEFEEHARRCRFNDCTHTHEPGCAVREAVERGELNPRRFEGYLRIFETIEEQ